MKPFKLMNILSSYLWLWSFLLLCNISLIINAKSIIPKKYPLFLQCDPRWGQDLMGGNNTKYDTICAQGCAMSSLSMALNGKGFKVVDKESNPGVLNAWLRHNHGYTCIAGDCDNLVLDSPNKLATKGKITFISEHEKPSKEIIRQWINEENPVAIAHVRHNSHFVLLTGYETDLSSNIFYVNDPFFPTNNYTYSDISDIISYYMM